MNLSFIRSFILKSFTINRIFLFTVVLPTSLAVIYWGIIASDIYVSESHFVVRTPQQQNFSSSGIGSALQGIGLSQPGGDPYTVKDYMESRDALRQLEDKLQVSKLYSAQHVDFINRFGGPVRWENDFEALQRYYRKRIEIDIDGSSNIGTLRVEAFRPEEAYVINEQLLEMSERLVNLMNERAQKDVIRFAEEEITKAEAKAKEAEFALSAYRNQKGIFDPERQATIALDQISKLQTNLITAKLQLVEVSTVSKKNPQIPTLRKTIETLQKEIDAVNAKVAGGQRSLSEKSAEYDRLALARDFAGKEFQATVSILEQELYQAQRQKLYLERVVQPNKPYMPKPRRIKSIIATLLTSLISWGIITLLIAGVREHRD